MKKMIIFEPAMCCQAGLCGASIDQELLRMGAVISNLEKRGIVIERYNLNSNPQAFVMNKTINDILNADGVDTLPVTIVDDEVVKTKEYPKNEELCKLLDIPESYLKAEEKSSGCGCGCKGGCC